jgi:hypothetical protein
VVDAIASPTATGRGHAPVVMIAVLAVDDPPRRVGAQRSRIADRERATPTRSDDFRSVSGAVADPLDRTGQAAQVEPIGVADDRRHQALLVDVDRDGQVCT